MELFLMVFLLTFLAVSLVLVGLVIGYTQGTRYTEERWRKSADRSDDARQATRQMVDEIVFILKKIRDL